MENCLHHVNNISIGNLKLNAPPKKTEVNQTSEMGRKPLKSCRLRALEVTCAQGKFDGSSNLIRMQLYN